MEQREETMVMQQRLLLPCAYPYYPNPNEVEMEVAEILTQLPDIISQFESPLPIPLCLAWGCKRRRRSAAAVKIDYAKPLPLPPANAVKVETSSPDTPLCFEHSESDDNSTRKVLGKRNVELHYSKLNGFNLDLKSRKEEEELMRVSHKQEEEPRLEPVMALPEPAQPAVVSPPPPPAANPVHYQHHQQIQIPAAGSVMLYQNQLQLIMMNQMAQTQRREICERMVNCNNNVNHSVVTCAMPMNSYRPYDVSWRNKKHLIQVLPIDPAAAKRNRLERLEKCRGKKIRCHAAR